MKQTMTDKFTTLELTNDSEQAQKRLDDADHTPEMVWEEGTGWTSPHDDTGVSLDEDAVEQARGDAEFVNNLLGK